MACRNDGADAEHSAMLSRKLDTLTRMLCDVCQFLEKEGVKPERWVPQLSVWWEQHQARDRAREKRERENVEEERRKKMATYEKLKRDLGVP